MLFEEKHLILRAV